MDDHNELENVDDIIPRSIDILTPCRKIPNPNKKTDSSSEKYSQTTTNLLKHDLSEEIKRYILSLEKNCNKSYIDEYIASFKDQISNIKYFFKKRTE